ncbi:hypothetical protein ACE1SV_67770 [Streptomyces sp. E-15]
MVPEEAGPSAHSGDVKHFRVPCQSLADIFQTIPCGAQSDVCGVSESAAQGVEVGRAADEARVQEPLDAPRHRALVFAEYASHLCHLGPRVDLECCHDALVKVVTHV